MGGNELKINIGTSIDLQDLIKSRMLIQANSGGGKSTIARVIMEQAIGKVPFIVLDIEGEYYTLKELNGDIIVVGGQHADVKISIPLASKLPKFIIENGLNVVIDVSDLEMHDRIRFSRIFLESLMQLPQQYWVPYLIFLEECHKLAGEQDKYESGPAVKDLMSRGRKRGYCGIPITQRISKLHKDVAAECNNKFIGRTHLDIDMDRAAKELGFSKASDRLILRDLKPGHFYAFGTSIQPHHVHEVIINKPATSMPQAGSAKNVTVKVATSKVVQLLGKLNDEVEKKPAPTTGKNTVAPNNDKHFIDEINQLKNQIIEKSNEVIDLKNCINSQSNLIEQVKSLLNKFDSAIVIADIPKKVITPAVKAIQPIKKIDKPAPAQNGSYKPGKCALAILQFLATYSHRSFSKAQVGVATGYSPQSGGFNNSLAELNSAGLLVRNDGKLQVNYVDNLTDYTGEIPHRNYDLNTFKEKLGKCEKEIYEVLLQNPYKEFSKDELAANTESNYSSTSGGFNNSLSTLNTLELIKRANGKIQLNPELTEFFIEQ
jgi:uncharacterized protein